MKCKSCGVSWIYCSNVNLIDLEIKSQSILKWEVPFWKRKSVVNILVHPLLLSYWHQIIIAFYKSCFGHQLVIGMTVQIGRIDNISICVIICIIIITSHDFYTRSSCLQSSVDNKYHIVPHGAMKSSWTSSFLVFLLVYKQVFKIIQHCTDLERNIENQARLWLEFGGQHWTLTL